MIKTLVESEVKMEINLNKIDELKYIVQFNN